MSDGRDFVNSEDGLETQAEAAKKGSGPLKAVDEEIGLDGMELGAEGDLDHELGYRQEEEDEGGNEGDDAHVVIKDGDTSKMEARYAVEGQPDYYHFITLPLNAVSENHTLRTINDWYLRKYRNIPLFGQSLKHLEKQYSSFDIRSAYDKKTHKYADFVEAHRPMHAMTEGGKGLAMYTRATIYMTADMSTINNVNITFGCWDLTDLRNYVTTPSGPVPISVVINERLQTSVLTPDGTFAPIVEHHDNGTKEVFEFEDSDGVVYVCTEDHPFMTEVDGKVVEMEIGEIFNRGLSILKHKA